MNTGICEEEIRKSYKFNEYIPLKDNIFQEPVNWIFKLQYGGSVNTANLTH